MALSYAQYPGNGSQQTFAVPFPYLKRADIQVRVNLDLVSFTWDDNQTIRVAPAPAAASVIEIRRFTQRDTRVVDFSDGSVLTETELDLANIQVFYIVQEAIDIAGGTLELLPDGSYGAGGRRIRNLGTAVDPRDAVTKEYHDGTFIPQMVSLLNQAVSAKDTSVASRDTAVSAMNTAIAHRDLALQYRDAAAASAASALASKNAAYTSESNSWSYRENARVYSEQALASKNAAATSEGNAWTYQNLALTYRNDAETFKNAAAASAAQAASFDPTTFMTKAGGIFTGPITVQNAYPNVVLKDTDTGQSRSVLNEGNLIGFTNASGNWNLNVTDGGMIWSPYYGNMHDYIWSVANERGGAHAAGRVAKGGDTMTGALWLNYANPMLNFYWAGVKHGQWWLDGSGNMIWRDGGGTNHFYITPGGAVWTQQLGDLNTRIEQRCDAWSAARREEANSYSTSIHNSQQGTIDDRVHRLQFVGYGESAAAGWSYDAPVVVNDCFWNYAGVQRRVKTLQMHIPGQGGWVNVWSS